ncbi:hypothetical protein BDV93DRAFT_542931 [Ceratobasidium sp. AG-I]|nr:hypothetical protein BDV93DRAFT_542931 [Ceratobasidium sp. AG-I]
MLGLELFSPSPSTSPPPIPRKKRKLRVEVVIPVRSKRGGVHTDSLDNGHASSRRPRLRDPKTGRLLPSTGRVVERPGSFMPWIAHASDSEYDPGESTTTSASGTPSYRTTKKALLKGHEHTSSSSRGAGNAGGQGKKRRRSPSPASPASSVSLGSTWYEPPKPKRAHRKRVKAGESKTEGKGKGKATEEDDKSVGVVRFRSTPMRSPSIDLPQNFDSEGVYYALEFGNKSRALREERMFEVSATPTDPGSPRIKNKSPGHSGENESYEVTRVEQELWRDDMQVESEEQAVEPKDESAMMDYELHESPPPERSPSHVSESIHTPHKSFSGVARSLARHPSDVHNTPSAAGSSTAPGTNEWLRACGVNIDDRSSHEKQAFTEDRLENEERASLTSDHTPAIKAPPIPTTPRTAITSQHSRLPHFTPIAQSVQRLDQSRKDFPPSSIRSNMPIGPATPQRPAEAEFTQRGVYRTPVHASGRGSQRLHPNPHADPPATPLPQVHLQDPDLEYLSAVGLDIELDRLSTHYGLNRDIVERVYQMKGGLSAATLTLEEMVSAMEGVLARRGS